MSLELVLQQFGISKTDATTLVADPYFHHQRKTFSELENVFSAIAAVYQWTEHDVLAAILKHPPFAGLDHARVVRQQSRVGILVHISEQQVLEQIIKNPVYASYSAKRYLAGIDIGRRLWREGYPNEKMLQKAFLNNVSKSPYVPRTKHQRISDQFQYQQEPPLLTAMRRYLQKN